MTRYTDQISTLFPTWNGEIAYVIGNSRELTGFNFRLLDSGLTIGVDLAGVYAESDITVSVSDPVIINKYTMLEAYAENGGFCVLALSAEYTNRVPAVSGALYVDKVQNRGLFLSDHTLSAQSSETAALSVAIASGAKCIYLLGFSEAFGFMGNSSQTEQFQNLNVFLCTDEPETKSGMFKMVSLTNLMEHVKCQ